MITNSEFGLGYTLGLGYTITPQRDKHKLGKVSSEDSKFTVSLHFFDFEMLYQLNNGLPLLHPEETE